MLLLLRLGGIKHGSSICWMIIINKLFMPYASLIPTAPKVLYKNINFKYNFE